MLQDQLVFGGAGFDQVVEQLPGNAPYLNQGLGRILPDVKVRRMQEFAFQELDLVSGIYAPQGLQYLDLAIQGLVAVDVHEFWFRLLAVELSQAIDGSPAERMVFVVQKADNRGRSVLLV